MTSAANADGRAEGDARRALVGWASVRASKAYGRGGPSLDHPILWVYERRGLPVRVVEATRDWRKIVDPDGAHVWVHRRLLSRTRTAFARGPDGGPAFLRAEPRPDAPVVAILGHGATARLVRCEASWCLLKRDGAEGWARKSEFHGADPEERF